MSSVPTGSVVPSIWAIFWASRCARLTPRVRSPTKDKSLAPPFRSRISWAMRGRARAGATWSRTCAFSRWRGAGLLIYFAPCGPRGARLKESASFASSHSTWPPPAVSTSQSRGRVSGTPALHDAPLVLDADAPGLHHEAARRQRRHDLLRPPAAPHHQIGPTPGGAAVIAQVQDARRI